MYMYTYICICQISSEIHTRTRTNRNQIIDWLTFVKYLAVFFFQSLCHSTLMSAFRERWLLALSLQWVTLDIKVEGLTPTLTEALWLYKPWCFYHFKQIHLYFYTYHSKLDEPEVKSVQQLAKIICCICRLSSLTVSWRQTPNLFLPDPTKKKGRGLGGGWGRGIGSPSPVPTAFKAPAGVMFSCPCARVKSFHARPIWKTSLKSCSSVSKQEAPLRAC